MPKSKRFGAAIDPIELYAAAIDTSDYVERVAPLIRRSVPTVGDLLDIGAGGGQLGRALHVPGCRWTAVEPSENMRLRVAQFQSLAQFRDDLRIVGSHWESAAIEAGTHDTVLAANIPPPLQQPDTFLSRCRIWARRTVVWVVPAQQGPHGLVFAGCLPAAWHGEDETPGVELVLRKLPAWRQPHLIVSAEWTFSAVVPDLGTLAEYLANRLGWSEADDRRSELIKHLAAQAKPDRAGYRLEIPRKSAVLVWGHPWVNPIGVT